MLLRFLTYLLRFSEMNVHASADERVVYLDKCIAAWNDSLMEASERIRLKEVNDVRAVQLLKGLRDEGLRLHSLPKYQRVFDWFSVVQHDVSDGTNLSKTWRSSSTSWWFLKSEAKECLLYKVAVFACKYVKKPVNK